MMSHTDVGDAKEGFGKRATTCLTTSGCTFNPACKALSMTAMGSTVNCSRALDAKSKTM